MSEVETLYTISLILIVTGFALLIFSTMLISRQKKRISLEQRREELEFSVPSFLGLVSENIHDNNLETIILKVINSPSAQSNPLVRYVKWLYNKVYRVKASSKYTFLEVLGIYIGNAYKDSALIALFYSVLSLASKVGSEAKVVVDSLATLSGEVVRYIVKMKTELRAVSELISTILKWFLPPMSALSIVIYAFIKSQTEQLSYQITGVMGGEYGTEGLFGFIKPMNFSIVHLTALLVLQGVVLSYFLTNLQMEVEGKYYAKAIKRIEVIQKISITLMLYGVSLFLSSFLLRSFFI